MCLQVLSEIFLNSIICMSGFAVDQHNNSNDPAWREGRVADF